MSSSYLPILVAVVSWIVPLPLTATPTDRHKLSLNSSWQFHLGDPEEDFHAADFDDSGWDEVHVPHTLELTSLGLDGCTDDKMQASFQRKVGWYRKDFTVTSDPDRKIFLEFEGAHQVTDLWINGQHVGQHSVGGYTPFHFDISSFVRRGEINQLTLKVDNRVRQDVPPDPGPFDYVKFSGLYRDVYLVETAPLRITFNWEALEAGVFITTPTVDPVNGNAVVDFKTVVRNDFPEAKQATLLTRVMDRQGRVVLKLEQTRTIPAGSDGKFNQIGAIEDELRLWSPSDPYLYRAQSMVMLDGKPADAVENRLGIRKFEHDPERGFLLNNKPIELIGANRHQHYGYIGDALPDSLHYKDMWQFKQLGFNVVRTAHYPQDDALLDACDELGILVYEEAPTWIAIPQNGKWHDNLETATRVMIRNHRNHPSVVIWGAGINHRGYVPRMVLACKQEDPTRLTASQSSRWTGWQTSGLSDLFANMMYGPGIWDRSEPLLAMEGRSGARAIGPYKGDPLMTGLISWTAHAYYTFHIGAEKEDRTRSGMMSVFRKPKRGLMWYPAELKSKPFIHIDNQWKEGIEQLTVFSNAEEVELLLNGQSFQRQEPSTDESYKGLDHPPFQFKIDAFQPGELEARGITDGKVIVSETIHTPGSPKSLELVMDTEARGFVADGSDIVVGHAYIVDVNGTTCDSESVEIHFSVDGPGSVVGDGEDIGANPVKTRNGFAPVLIRAGTEPGKLTVTATAEGLNPSTVTLTTSDHDPIKTSSDMGPIYDFESLRVDLGAEDQLVQFGWTPWNGDDNQPAEKHLDLLGGITARIKTISDDGILRWLGEMNVIGKNGFAYGEGVIAVDPEGLLLEFEGLPEGLYKLRSWHHAPRSNTDSMDPNRERLKTIDSHKLPYAQTLQIEADGRTATTQVTQGNEMQFSPVATADTLIEAKDGQVVRVIFKDPAQKKGIWLNAFELSQWHRDLEEPKK